MASADAPVPRCTCDVRNLATCSTVNQDTTSRVVRSYRPHGSLARLLYDKQKADEQLEAYDKTQWYKVDRTKIREDLLRLWIPLGAGFHHDQPDKTAEIFLMKSIERSDSLPLQAWHSLARSALSWFISRTSINGLLGRGSMHVFSCEQFQKLMVASGFLGPWHSLVDLGAGDGATTAHVAHLFEKVYATDISAPMRWALAKKKFTVLDVEKWYENSPFNVILCLNLLDRCDRPNTLLRRLKSSLAPGGRLVVALVLPFSPYVEVGERDDHKPSEYLPVKGNGLEGQIASLVDRVFAPLSLRCLAWSKLPYLCEGDLGQAYYFLDDVIFVLEAQPDSSRYSASEWMDTELFERKCCNILEQQSGNERNTAVIPIMKIEKNIPKSVNMASRYNHAIQRVLAKLEASVNSENYYEAHQMYRTLYFRYLGQKKYSELLELLYNGCTLLLQHEQHASGADLGILFVNVLTQSGTEPSQDYFEKITNLFSIMSPLSPERDVFVQSALRWSIKNTDYKIGHPDLHQKIAQVFWREKNYVMARQHFIYSRDGSGCATMLVELHEQRGYKNEIDLFIAQAVLQYLCLQNKTTAQEVFNSYTSQHPKINRGPPYLLPLLNFLFFLLKIVDSGKLAVFTVLCEQYRISLNRDPCYRQYLDKIGQLFFNVPSPRPRNQGLFGTLLQSFFNGLEDEGSDDEQRNIASTSQTAQELD